MICKTVLTRPALVLILLVAAESSAQDPGRPKLSAPATGELIQQLGAPSFQQRERAAKEILARGILAKADLEAAGKHPDLEIRLRVKELLGRISQGDFEHRLAAFIADVAGKEEHHLPGWQHYLKVAGSDSASRRLFAQMCREELELLRMLERPPEQISAMYLQRIAALRLNYFPANDQSVSQATLATLLLLGSNLGDAFNSQHVIQFISYLNRPAAKQHITEGHESAPMKKIFGAWITAGADTPRASTCLSLVMQYDLKELGLSLGRKFLQKKTTSFNAVPYAILLIGKNGSQKDVDLLQPLLKNERLFFRWTRSDLEKTMAVQVRDIALAVLIHLTDQNHQDYGFDFFQYHPTSFMNLHSLGFTEEKQRQAALKKWQDWSQTHAG